MVHRNGDKTMNPMPTFACYINNVHAFNVSAVSYRQAVQRAKRKTRGPVDVIGLIAPCERIV
jgi:hypothetical protein